MTAKNFESVHELKYLEPFMKKLEDRGVWTQLARKLDENKTFSAGPSLTHIFRIEKS